MTPKDKELYKFLQQFTTEERKKRFEEVLNYRTRHVTGLSCDKPSSEGSAGT